jgi:signal transduction histidine kinase/CheY-like chemotaxis protein/HPt (histidine-containing phosphotransfer) domain-containing protein
VNKPKLQYYWIVALISIGIIANFSLEFFTRQSIRDYMLMHDKIIELISFEAQLSQLKNDITLVQSRIRGLVITGDHDFVTDVDKDIEGIEIDLRKISHSLGKQKDPVTKNLIDSLNVLVQKKVQLNYHILEAYNSEGKEAAEKIIKTKIGITLRNKIYKTIDSLSWRISYQNNNALVRSLIISSKKQGEQTILLDTWVPIIISILFLLFGSIILAYLKRNNRLIDQLESTRKMEAMASVVKNQFIANMNHELRTPLNSVIGYTHLMQKTDLSNEQAKFLRAIQSSSEMLLQIINKVLDFSKLEAGILYVEKINFSLRELISLSEESFKDVFEKKQILLSIEIDDAIPEHLTGDVLKVRQVIYNILTNAYKFTEEGSVKVTVQLKKTESKLVWIEFTFKDTGIGIEEKHLKHIFERFYQVEQGLDRKFDGTGLGLAIVQQLVTALKGRITVTSKVGEGTTFVVTIPFDESRNSESLEEPSIKIPSEQSKKVLIVDDNELNRSLVAHVLHTWNYTTVEATSGKDALKMLLSENFDLILLDIQMPQMDGYVTAYKIRNELHLPIPIIALTAHSSKEETEKCIKAGMNDHVSKPFNEIELFGVISRVLRNKEQNIINRSYLKEISGGDMEFEKKVTRQFINHLPPQLIKLRKNLLENEIVTLNITLHELKSNLSVFALHETLAKPLEKLSSFPEKTSKEEAIQSLKTIEDTCTNAIKILRD